LLPSVVAYISDAVFWHTPQLKMMSGRSASRVDDASLAGSAGTMVLYMYQKHFVSSLEASKKFI